MSRYTSYGPGDEITWGACAGHPNDPRTDDCSYDKYCQCVACTGDDADEDDEEF